MPIAVCEWQGWLFANLSGDAPPLEASFDENAPDQRLFVRWNLGELRVAHVTSHDIAANWKHVMENHVECLHCATIHPRYTQLSSVWRAGDTGDYRDDRGVQLESGFRRVIGAGTQSLPDLPNFSADEASAYYFTIVFPTTTFETYGFFATVTNILPRAVDRTTFVTTYLFAPETIEDDRFDPSDVIAFVEEIIEQDRQATERVQRGVASRAWRHGVYAEAECSCAEFDQFYLDALGPSPI
jgi:phenylpropionate dioxygenase-like ring-hydroxylating dioxygenase large terminal subunit